MIKGTWKRVWLFGGTVLAVIAVFLVWVGFFSSPHKTLARSVEPLAQTVDPAQLVEQFFPQSLIDRAIEAGVQVDQDSCFAVFDTLPSGDPKTIIAGYAEGGIQVIQEQGDGSHGVVFQLTEEFLLGGLKCRMRLIDLDGDGTNEIKASFTGMRIFTADWYFRWDGLQLINLGPTTQDPPPYTVLSTTGLADLDHDGTLEILSQGDSSLLPTEEGFVPTPPVEVYKSLGGPYTFDRTLASLGMFVRDKGEPQTETQSISLAAQPTGSFVLRVINGRHDGSNRVASARIMLNGEEVLSPDFFSQQVEFLTIPVTLQRNNALKVTLDGKPLGTIIITIEPADPATP